MVPLAPPVPLVPLPLLLGGQDAEALLALPGMHGSLPMPEPLVPELPAPGLPEPLPEPLGIPELLLPPPLEFGLVVPPPY